MKRWAKISLLLCVFGFLKEIRPSEPFIYEFLTGPDKNFTDDQINNEMFPIASYSGLIYQAILFLVTDICRYKPFIFLIGLCGGINYCLLIWPKQLIYMQISQAIYGLFLSAEVAYFSYIYAKVEKEHYQKVAAHSRAAVLVGRTLSGVMAQICVSFNLADLLQLNYVSAASGISAAIWSFFLPSVTQSIYFHSEEASKDCSKAFLIMKRHFISAYTNSEVLKWSIWYALSTGGYLLIDVYIQALYAAIQTTENSYNGAVLAILMFCSFLSAMLAGYLKANWKVLGSIALGSVSLMQGALLMTAAKTANIVVCYASYVMFSVFFHFMITVTSAQVAKNIEEDSYGLVFGINTFAALVIDAILVVVFVAKDVGFALDARGQFFAFGIYHVVTALIFVVLAIKQCSVSRRRRGERISYAPCRRR